MRKTLILLLVCLGMFSCAEKIIPIPENLIDQQTMENILYDLSLLNAGKNTNVTVLHTYDWIPMPFVYKKYKIDSIQFVKSDIYYASMPEKYIEIYTNIDNRLKADKTALEKARDSEMEAKRTKRDSIKKLPSKKEK